MPERDYRFTIFGSVGVTLDVTYSSTPSMIAGAGQGYAVYAASGHLGGTTFTNLDSSGGDGADNAIFPTDGTGKFGSSLDGLDAAGIALDTSATQSNGTGPARICYRSNSYGIGTFYYESGAGTYYTLSLTNVTVINCFAAGTKILTRLGEVPVEQIKVGDLVVSVRSLALRPVIWTGQRHINLRRHAAMRESLAPIRFLAGAISDGIPERDFCVSPHHGIFLNNQLFEAQSLVNGISIFQDFSVSEITYHHFELDEHDIVLAEGCPAESFLDTGDRHLFTGGPVTALRPNFMPAPPDAAFCVPLIRDDGVLEDMRAQLAQRARRLRARMAKLRLPYAASNR